MTTAIAPFVQRRRELRQGLQHVGEAIPAADRRLVGCEKCRHGLLGDLRTDGPGPLYLLRYYQAQAHTIEFCSCESGQHYRAYLLKRHDAIKAGEDVIPGTMRDQIAAWVEDLPAPEIR